MPTHPSPNSTPHAQPMPMQNAAPASDANRPRMAGPAYPDPLAPETPPNNQKSITIAAIAVGAGLMVVGLGLAIGGRSSAQPAPAPVVVAPPSMFEEQRQMMKEAMQMAKDAQQAQREHMEKVNRMMRDEADVPR